MNLGIGVRFRNKKKILATIQSLLSEWTSKGVLKEEELERIVAFSKEKLIVANTPSDFDSALNTFFTEFKVFASVEVKERRERLEAVEQVITSALIEAQNADYLQHLHDFDVNSEKGILTWLHSLSPWEQSRVYDALLTTSN